jgi:glycine/D-amino acid oxidase-like deaminating enzyme
MLTTAHDVAIGSGVAGASTAFALPRRGASLTVVDAAHTAPTNTHQPNAPFPPLTSGSTGSLRRDHLGGLIHEYLQVT